MKHRDYFSDTSRAEGLKTIGYFGDSFCASRSKTSWCKVLARKIDRWPVHWGTEGASIWNTFLTIEDMLVKDTLPDTLFLCYTEPYRIYHPTLSLTPNSTGSKQEHNKIYGAADMYRVHLQNNKKDDLAYRYSLQWFDQNVLKPLEAKHEIIQIWSMPPTEISSSNMEINLTTGLMIKQSILDFAYRCVGAGPGFKFDPSWGNHMSDENNVAFANHILPKVEAYLK